jgi:acyl carrier protein
MTKMGVVQKLPLNVHCIYHGALLKKPKQRYLLVTLQTASFFRLNSSFGVLTMDTQLDAKQMEMKLIKIVADKLNIEEKNITTASRFQEDLGADSLDIVELLMEIEEVFGVNISDEESERLKTVGDAVKFIVAKL